MSIQPSGLDPTIHRRRLRKELRRARESAGKTQADARTAMDWSLSKLIRIESGAVNISTNDLRALLGYYQLPPERVDALVEVARAARAATPWSTWRNIVTPEYMAFLGYESSASVIRNFEPLLVPGLLQTEEYARTVIRALEPNASADLVDDLVDLRVQRQEILTREAPPRLNFTLDESVIRRRIGGTDVMRRQLRQLLELAEQEHVTLRVVPFEHGMYGGIRVPYVLFEFPDDEDENILYVENPTGELIVREDSIEEHGFGTPVEYLELFWDLEQVATRDAAPVIINQALRDLTES